TSFTCSSPTGFTPKYRRAAKYSVASSSEGQLRPKLPYRRSLQERYSVILGKTKTDPLAKDPAGWKLHDHPTATNPTPNRNTTTLSLRVKPRRNVTGETQSRGVIMRIMATFHLGRRLGNRRLRRAAAVRALLACMSSRGDRLTVGQAAARQM